MLIGLHDSDKNKFPNYALMKISAFHKAQGDDVQWWNPLEQFDKVYSSKVFTFTPEEHMLPEDVIRGGLLVQDIKSAEYRATRLRDAGVDVFAQPYRDFENKIEPTKEMRDFARWVNRKQIFKSTQGFAEYKRGK